MNGTIWKFPVPVADEFSIKMPHGAELLMVAPQDDQVCLWARVRPANMIQKRHFILRGTGHPIDFDSKHIGSFLLRNGTLVFHLFEIVR